MGNYVQDFLKRKYSSAGKVENAAHVNTVLLRDIPRTQSPGGESFNSFLTVSGGVGWSGTRAGAQAIANQGGDRGNGVFQQIRNSYGKVAGEVTIDEFAVKQGNDANAAAIRAIGAHVDSHLDGFGQMAEWMILGHRGMYVATGTISSGVVTLTSNPEHITRIRNDMVLVASDNNGTTGSLLGSGSQGFVISVSRSGSSPTFTVSTTSGGSAGTPSGWTGTMFFFIVGTHFPANGGGGIDGGTNRNFVIDTLDSWVPATTGELSANFKNMDQTADEVLGGVRLTTGQVATLDLLERIELLATTGRSRFGWRDDGGVKCYVHTTRFNEMNQLLQRTDVRNRGYSGASEMTKYGYRHIMLASRACNIEVCDSPMADENTAWVLRPSAWNLHSSAGWPSVVNEDGLRFSRNPTSDSFSLQYTGYGSLRTEDPSKTGRAPLN